MVEIYNDDNSEVKSVAPEKRHPEAVARSDNDKEKLSPKESDTSKVNRKKEAGDPVEKESHPKLEVKDAGSASVDSSETETREANKRQPKSLEDGGGSKEKLSYKEDPTNAIAIADNPKENKAEGHDGEWLKFNNTNKNMKTDDRDGKPLNVDDPNNKDIRLKDTNGKLSNADDSASKSLPDTREASDKHNTKAIDDHDETDPHKAEIDEMYRNGELTPVEYSDDVPIERKDHLPTENTGFFDGERGDSLFHPDDEAAQRKINEYGGEGVYYKNGVPDFLPFSTHDSPWGKADTTVEIPHMTDQRANPSWEYGERRPDGTSHDPLYDIGNFAQADNSLADRLSTPDHRVTPDDIEGWRKDNGLVWHECDDGKTMQLVPREIHDACKHSGGVSEMKERLAWGNYMPSDLD